MRRNWRDPSSIGWQSSSYSARPAPISAIEILPFRIISPFQNNFVLFLFLRFCNDLLIHHRFSDGHPSPLGKVKVKPFAWVVLIKLTCVVCFRTVEDADPYKQIYSKKRREQSPAYKNLKFFHFLRFFFLSLLQAQYEINSFLYPLK